MILSEKCPAVLRALGFGLCILGLSACGRGPGAGIGGSAIPKSDPMVMVYGRDYRPPTTTSTLSDLFNGDNPNTTVEVNKYLWNASLEILNFLPIESVDPFTGVIVTGFGTPPGGGRAYRATVYVQDPALDARSLKVALSSSSGAVSADTVRAIEDAILTRARQLRIRDSGL